MKGSVSVKRDASLLARKGDFNAEKTNDNRRVFITEDKISDDTARIRTMVGMALELKYAELCKAEVLEILSGSPEEAR